MKNKIRDQRILWHWFTKPPLFDIKLEYFSVIEVADSESDLGLFSTALVPEIFAFDTFWNEVDQDVVVMYTLVKFF